MPPAFRPSLSVAFCIATIPALAQAPATPRDWDVAREYAVRARADGSRYVADEILIGMHADADRAGVLAALAARGAEPLGELTFLRVVRAGLPAGEDPLAVAPLYAGIAGVAYAEPNDVGEGGWLGTSNDTFFGSQWHHENTGQGGGTPGADIETLPAWPLAANPQPVVLAILDTGIDFTHPEFLGRVVPGWDFVNEDSDATADHSHGISCAGLAAANVGNNFGVAGVDPTCTIYPVKVLNQNNGGNVTDLVQGLQHCAQNGIEVVSMSLINYGSGQTLENGLIAARNAGCILVACAGNGGIGDADFSGPGQSAQTISIGATTRNDTRAGFSGTGLALDFVAPGSNVVTASTSHANTSSSFSGCSAATPVAAGIVALMVGQDPTLTQAEIFDLLKLGAEDQVGTAAEDLPGRDNFMGWGRLNARRSLASLSPCRAPSAYGIGKTTSIGTQPFVSSTGTPRFSFNDFQVTTNQALPLVLSIAFHGPGPDSLPWFGGTLLVAAPLVRLPAQNLDATGHGAWEFPIEAGMIGTTRCFQNWFRDPAHPDGTAVGITNALSVTFCP